MVEGCSPAVSEDRGSHGRWSGIIAYFNFDVSYKLMNLKIILLLIHCLVDMPTSQARLTYLVMSDRYRIVRVMVFKGRWATLFVILLFSLPASLPCASPAFHLVHPPLTFPRISVTTEGWGEHHFYHVTAVIEGIIVLLFFFFSITIYAKGNGTQ